MFEEANAISSTANFALMPPKETQRPILKLLRQYVLIWRDLNIPYNPTKMKSEIARSVAFQNTLWQQAIQLNAHGASLQDQTLTLTSVSTNSIVFADRPVHAAGHMLTSHVLEEWTTDGSFAKDPPNATVSVLSRNGGSAQTRLSS